MNTSTNTILLQLPRMQHDFFPEDKDKRIALDYRRVKARQWMWLNNIREYRYELLLKQAHR